MKEDGDSRFVVVGERERETPSFRLDPINRQSLSKCKIILFYCFSLKYRFEYIQEIALPTESSSYHKRDRVCAHLEMLAFLFQKLCRCCVVVIFQHKTKNTSPPVCQKNLKNILRLS